MRTLTLLIVVKMMIFLPTYAMEKSITYAMEKSVIETSYIQQADAIINEYNSFYKEQKAKISEKIKSQISENLIPKSQISNNVILLATNFEQNTTLLETLAIDQYKLYITPTKLFSPDIKLLQRCILFAQIQKYLTKITQLGCAMPSLQDYDNYEHNEQLNHRCNVGQSYGEEIGVEVTDKEIESHALLKPVQNINAVLHLKALLSYIKKMIIDKKIEELHTIAQTKYHNHIQLQ